jgi:hypothetical protein
MEAKIPKKQSRLQPCIGLFPAPLETVPKSDLIEFQCRITAAAVDKKGTGSGPVYKTTVRRFNEGTPEQWIAVLTAFKEIWTQNQISNPADRLATIRAVLRDKSLAQFEASIIKQQEDKQTEALAEDENASVGPIAITNLHITVALSDVAEYVFPHRALEMQKMWMKRGIKKPKDMTFRALNSALNRMNNALPHFPGGSRASKLTEVDLIESLEWAVPETWRAHFDLDGYVPTLHPREQLLKACAAIERSTEVPTNYQHPPATKKEIPKKKTSSKSKHGFNKKGAFYCSHHGHNNTHGTSDCYTLNNQQSGPPAKAKKPFSATKKLFKKELHLLGKQPGAKAKALEAYSQLIEQEKLKLGKARAKDPDTDDDSVHIIDVVPAPKKKARKPSLDTDDEASTYSADLAKEFNAKIKLAQQQAKLAEFKKRAKKLGTHLVQTAEDDMSIESQGTEEAEWDLDLEN